LTGILAVPIIFTFQIPKIDCQAGVSYTDIVLILRKIMTFSFFIHGQIGANLLHLARVAMVDCSQHKELDVSRAKAELDIAKNYLHNSIRLVLMFSIQLLNINCAVTWWTLLNYICRRKLLRFNFLPILLDYISNFLIKN